MNPLIFSAGIFGALGVIFGAFGAHYLDRILDPDSLETFKLGVRYQLYHAIVLLALGAVHAHVNVPLRLYGAFILGIILFSGSLYCLSFWKVRFIGPITPLGGLLLIIGWLQVILYAFKASN